MSLCVTSCCRRENQEELELIDTDERTCCTCRGYRYFIRFKWESKLILCIAIPLLIFGGVLIGGAKAIGIDWSRITIPMFMVVVGSIAFAAGVLVLSTLPCALFSNPLPELSDFALEQKKAVST